MLIRRLQMLMKLGLTSKFCQQTIMVAASMASSSLGPTPVYIVQFSGSEQTPSCQDELALDPCTRSWWVQLVRFAMQVSDMPLGSLHWDIS